jgi:D-alanyl-D-alanine carboxypeptidase
VAPVPARTAKNIDAAAFDRHAGRYRLSPEQLLTVSRDGERFLAQVSGFPAVPILPESETTFFSQNNVQFVFEVDAAGKTTAVSLVQNGRSFRAAREP